ncbi:Arsenite methyltransferase [Lamellibrachia satsuma]|nr:Arsenite methyltransferase [Lamellibrachia satsuma]
MNRSQQAADKSNEILESVKEYYGKVLKKAADLKTDACCTLKYRMVKSTKEALALVHDDVVSRYFGCGLIAPECIEGMKILDLGSGAGHDCYILSKLVGEQGHVTGIDMTEEQLEVARKYQQFHADKFGFSKPNTDFVKGYIENLGAAGLTDKQFDLIISNCVVNLSPDKRAVLTEAYRVLKEGGELFFGDMYADRDLPEVNTY